MWLTCDQSPGRGQFGAQDHRMNNLGRGPLEDASYKISKLYDFQFQRTLILCFKIVTQGRGQFGPQGHHLNKLGKGKLADATYQILKLYSVLFQRRRILKFSFFVPMFQPCDQRGGTSFDPKAIT